VRDIDPGMVLTIPGLFVNDHDQQQEKLNCISSARGAFV
jgi:hypothetical protein